MMKFYSYNLVQQDQTLITASNEDANFPVSNIKDYRASKVFRSTGTSSQIVFDFITTEPVDSILIIPHSLYGWGLNTPITIEANATNSWGSPAFTTTITSGDLDQVHKIARKEFAEQNYRFWRISISGTSYAELGKIFIGQAINIGERGPDLNWSFIDQDLSTSTKNRFGQRFTDVLGKQKRFSVAFQYMDKDEVDSFFSIMDYNSTTKPLFVRFDCPDILNNINRFAAYAYLDQIPEIINPSYALYSGSLTFEEAK